MLSLFVILSLSPIPPNTETMVIYNSKKKGEKEKKIHGRGSKPGDATNTRVSPFTTSLQAFASFLFISYKVCTFLLALEHVAVRK
jgi:hypothetical protein